MLAHIIFTHFFTIDILSLQEYNDDDFETPAVSPVGSPIRKSKSNVYVPPVLQNFEAEHKQSATALVHLAASRSNDFSTDSHA